MSADFIAGGAIGPSISIGVPSPAEDRSPEDEDAFNGDDEAFFLLVSIDIFIFIQNVLLVSFLCLPPSNEEKLCLKQPSCEAKNDLVSL